MPMQFSYFGATPTVSTLASPLGTKAELAAWIRDQLIAAGWTVLSGAGTGVVKLRSAVTPHGIRHRVQINDTSDATSVKIYALSDDELSQGTGSFLFPTALFNWRLIASPYYLRVFRDIGSVQNRDCFQSENLYITAPDRGSVTEAFFTSSNSTTVGSDASVNGHLRSTLNGNNTNDRYIVGFNGSRWVNAGANAGGTLATVVPANLVQGVSYLGSRKYWSGAFDGWDVWIGFGSTGSADPALMRGIMGDAFLYCDAVPYGTIWTIDSHQWFCYTFGSTLYSIFLLIS